MEFPELALYVAFVIGCFSVVSVIYVWIKKQVLGNGGIVLCLSGVFLMSLPFLDRLSIRTPIVEIETIVGQGIALVREDLSRGLTAVSERSDEQFIVLAISTLDQNLGAFTTTTRIPAYANAPAVDATTIDPAEMSKEELLLELFGLSDTIELSPLSPVNTALPAEPAR